MVPSMRRVVGALLAAIPGLSLIVLVLLIIYYVFAVIVARKHIEADLHSEMRQLREEIRALQNSLARNTSQ
jgi:hypothetical protein